MITPRRPHSHLAVAMTALIVTACGAPTDRTSVRNEAPATTAASAASAPSSSPATPHASTSTPAAVTTGTGMSGAASTGAGSPGLAPRAGAPNAKSAPAPAAAGKPRPGWWKPKPGLSWQIQYKGKPDLSQRVAVYNLDWNETSASTVAALKRRGVKPVCYLNAGGFEDWRPDIKRFPRSVLGKPLDDWKGERWLDIRKRSQLMPIMTARMNVCKAKGFVAIDPDNLDGYNANSGFPLRASDALAYERDLARAAHARGLAIGLKNALEILPAVTRDVDFAVNEECVQYDECGIYKRFIAAGKPVFHVEYSGSPSKICAKTPKGFSTVIKAMSLTAPTTRCR